MCFSKLFKKKRKTVKIIEKEPIAVRSARHGSMETNALYAECEEAIQSFSKIVSEVGSLEVSKRYTDFRREFEKGSTRDYFERNPEKLKKLAEKLRKLTAIYGDYVGKIEVGGILGDLKQLATLMHADADEHGIAKLKNMFLSGTVKNAYGVSAQKICEVLENFQRQNAVFVENIDEAYVDLIKELAVKASSAEELADKVEAIVSESAIESENIESDISEVWNMRIANLKDFKIRSKVAVSKMESILETRFKVNRKSLEERMWNAEAKFKETENKIYYNEWKRCKREIGTLESRESIYNDKLNKLNYIVSTLETVNDLAVGDDIKYLAGFFTGKKLSEIIEAPVYDLIIKEIERLVSEHYKPADMNRNIDDMINERTRGVEEVEIRLGAKEEEELDPEFLAAVERHIDYSETNHKTGKDTDIRH